MSILRKAQVNPGRTVSASLAIVAVGLMVAALMSAPLTWDGSLYFTWILETHSPLVAQGRIADKYFQYPIVWVLELSGSWDATLLAFSIIHVATPLLALGLSWWIVRDTAAHLMVWPMLGILLALFPGQINFISEGIKAEQLMWPLLLGLLTGARPKAVPLLVFLAFSIYHLHPVAAPLLAACGLAAIAVGIVAREFRSRLLILGVTLVAAGAYKYSGLTDSYAQSEMSLETQQRQWENGAHGWPMVAIIASFIVALGLVASPFLSGTPARVTRCLQLIAILVASVALAVWASQPSLWWEALEFRGPAFWITMGLSGCLFLHCMVFRFWQGESYDLYLPHILAISVGFAVALSTQSIAWKGVLTNFEHTLATAGNHCIAREDLPGYPYTPLNLWSTNPLSFIHQGYTPTNMSMSALECNAAKESGAVSDFGLTSGSTVNRFNYSTLSANLQSGNVCNWHHSEGWHQPEALIPDAWRWSGSEGTLQLTYPEAGTISISATIQSIQTPNVVTLFVNGELVEEFIVESGSAYDVKHLTVNVQAGNNVITFSSANEPTALPTDERPLAISLWNTTIHPGDGSSRCVQTDAP